MTFNLPQDYADTLYRELQTLLETRASPVASTLLEIRKMLEEVLEELCAPAQKYFQSPYDKMLFIQQNAAGLSEEFIDQMHALRKLCNQSAHKRANIEPPLLFQAALAFSLIIETFSSLVPPQSLRRLYENYSPLQNKPGPVKQYDTIERLDVTILKILKLNNETPPRYFKIEAITDDGRPCVVSISDGLNAEQYGAQLTRIYPHLRVYTALRFFYLRLLKTEPYLEYGSFHSTLMVFSPHYLENVTSVAECFREGKYFWRQRLLDLFLQDDTNPEPRLKGSIVNAVFDELLHHSERSDDEIYQSASHEFAFEICTLGLKIINFEIRNIRELTPQDAPYLSHLTVETYVNPALRERLWQTIKVYAENLLARFPEASLRYLETQKLLERVDKQRARFAKDYTPETLEAAIKLQTPNLRGAVEFLKETNDCLVEPAYVAPDYGLTGRLDVLVTGQEPPHKVSVVELKSGRPPAFTANENRGLKSEHHAQTQAYQMLLEGVFPPNKIGGAAIFYSEAQEEPIRYARTHEREKQKILMMRNIIVANEYKLTQDPKKVFESLRFDKDNREHYPNFGGNKLEKFELIYQNLSEEEKAYLHAFTALIAREHWNAKIGVSALDVENNADYGFSSLWRLTPQEKFEQMSLLAPLRLVSDEEEPPAFLQGETPPAHHFIFYQENELPPHNFRPGDLAVLYPLESDGTLQPAKHELLNARIIRLTQNYVEISLRNQKIDASNIYKYTYWAIEPGFMDKNYESLYRNLFHFIGHNNQERKALVLGQRPPRPIPETPPYQPEYSFPPAPTQQKIICKALCTPDYYLIQGPPGTGKTSVVLASIVLNLYKFTNENIVILAFTNRAVDEICEKLIQNDLPFYRLGRSELDSVTTKAEIIRELKSGKTDLAEIAIYLHQTRIFVSTISSYISEKSTLAYKSLDTVIIDEASQLLEAHLAGVVIDFKRFILIGDEKQLPAIVTQTEQSCKTQNKLLIQMGIHNLGQSFFERLLFLCKSNEWDFAFDSLEEHNRMHQNIAALLNEPQYLNFYNGILKERSERQRNPNPFIQSVGPLTQKIAPTRFCFFDFKPESGKTHHAQISFILELLVELSAAYQLEGKEFSTDSIGIITPFRAQNVEIAKKLMVSESRFANAAIYDANHKPIIAIDTVERFQGSERDIIILSLSVNHRWSLNAVRSLAQIDNQSIDRKLNVAISRAKEYVIFLGCSQILSYDRNYQKLITAARSLGAFWQA